MLTTYCTGKAGFEADLCAYVQATELKNVYKIYFYGLH